MIRPAITAEQVPAAWIAAVREVARRDGHAVRAHSTGSGQAGAGAHTIEVQSINTGEWQPLMLPGDGCTFATVADRDAVLRQIHQGK